MEAMLLNNRQSKILQILQGEGKFVSGKALSIELGVSVRTIRNDIKFLNNEYLLDAHIESNNRLGYKIKGKMASFQSRDFADYEFRAFFIIQYLMEQESWFTYRMISEEIDVSSQTINSDITKISKFIEDKHFNLTLDTKPFVGVRLVGNEIDKRSLLGILASFVSKYHTTNEEFCHELENLFKRWLSKDEIKQVSQTLYNHVNDNDTSIDREKWSSLVINVLIQKHRLKFFIIPDYEIDFYFNINKFAESQLAFSITKEMCHYNQVHIKTEIYYLTFLLIGLKVLHFEKKNKEKILKTYVYEKIEDAIDFTGKKYGYGLLNDIQFKKDLTEHLEKIIYPIKHNIEVKNPLLNQVKSQYIQAYQMAIVFSEYLGNDLKLRIPENEVGYIALHIEASIERKNDLSTKLAILSIESKIITTLIKQKIEKNFQKIKIIVTFFI